MRVRGRVRGRVSVRVRVNSGSRRLSMRKVRVRVLAAGLGF